MTVIQIQLDEFLKNIINHMNSLIMIINYECQNNEDIIEQLYSMTEKLLSCDNIKFTVRSTLLRAMKCCNDCVRQNEIDEKKNEKSVESDNDTDDKEDNDNINDNNIYNLYVNYDDMI
ncbi:hypothetical protein EMCG_07495 [[Emmonsia] crescens]|uniref:Uncharacterized protein n=1 Tax=[Emmonsia] crescens TaxID=73230 RepID=A0A0G2JB38_9EURO|nr:hypothetical protein EMCG_07495 [Emmonsia crescens UAMH 3008]